MEDIGVGKRRVDGVFVSLGWPMGMGLPGNLPDVLMQ